MDMVNFPKFPSPFGVHVLKVGGYYAYNKYANKFPSPFGVHVLKFVCDVLELFPYLEFPSPFGVHVLKSGIIAPKTSCAWVSVPFRGSRSEMIDLPSYMDSCPTVSVPFRGSRSEIAKSDAISSQDIVSVPFRGSRSEM